METIMVMEEGLCQEAKWVVAVAKARLLADE